MRGWKVACEDRTAQLSRGNTDLRREVAERRAAETQLKKAQADLVQAGKLSALGQMSAGISHELNQPLMAIQTFAENGVGFLERGQAGGGGDKPAQDFRTGAPHGADYQEPAGVFAPRKRAVHGC